MKAIPAIQALWMSLTIGVTFSSYITPRNNICTGIEDGVLLANTYDCSSYFVCNYGVAHLFNCSLDLLFDVDLGVCNWPKNVSCAQVVDRPVYPQQSVTPPSRPAIDDPSQGLTTLGWAPLPPNWPHAPSVPQDTNESIDGRPDGGWIDDDAWVNGGMQPIGETKPNTNVVEFYPGLTVKSINPTTFACSRDNFYFAPHPTSCQNYFICSNRQLHEHQCGKGIQWDFINARCEFIENATCFSRHQQQHENDSFTVSVPANHEVDSNTIIDAEDGTEGVLDPGFDMSEGIIDTDDPDFDPDFMQYTEEPPLEASAENETDNEIDTDFDQLPFSEEVASDHTPEPDHNETNDVIDPGFNLWPLNNTASNRTGGEIDPNYTVTPPSDEKEIFTVGIPEWDNVPDSNETVINIHLPQCPEIEQKFLSHSTDCTKYYICISGEAILTKCPESLYWDHEKAECAADKTKCAIVE